MSLPAVLVPKDRFTALDTAAVAREIRAAGRIRFDKAYDVPNGGIAASFRVPGSGRRELVILPGRFAAFLSDRGERIEELGRMALALRRLLSGAVVTDVDEPAGERYLSIRLTRSDVPEPVVLGAELFGAGNLVVVRGDRVAAVLHAKTWAHRILRIGATFAPPPRRRDPFAASVAELEQQLEGSRTDRATTLAARLAFGGHLAEELLARAHLDGAVPAPTEPRKAASALHKAIAELLAEVGESPKGYLYAEKDVYVDVTPFRSTRLGARDGMVEEVRPTFSEAAHRYFTSLAVETAPPVASPAELRRSELTRLLERQSTAVAELESNATTLVATADLLYRHFAEAEERLRSAAEATPADGPLTVELEGRTLEIPRAGSVKEAAKELFDESKRIRAKLEGARLALANTTRTLESSAPIPPPRTGGRRTQAETDRARRLWFEKFRWFVSSEGVLVIAGRDAASNDLVVRRYLHDRDLYVHAEIHGAPSVVVRNPLNATSPVGPATLAEAAQFGVAYSKAWRAGLASGEAFWVRADQVSKAGASGEFVPRGAFVIHGTKTILRDLPLELAIGTVDYEGRELWSVAPPAAVRSRGEIRFLLRPGEERDRNAREVELAGALGLSRDRLQSLLPAGGLEIRRT
ncbi:MAG TPA: ribosome rescue protein RqcH [Thermoplasmata archaeon]|nr:ribosome rescue protein RqcH [Thermoplasmata archaeon]